MEQMEIFKNPEFGSIRVIEENGKYLFCGADVARALGYVKTQNAISAHCKGALKRGTLTDRGMQQLLYIPEGDVYRLIIHSKLPSAERFSDGRSMKCRPPSASMERTSPPKSSGRLLHHPKH